MTIDFEKIKDLHIVCIGDIMLDEFIYGSVARISPEAPVPVLKSKNNITMLGGVGNVVTNLHFLGAKVTVFSIIGQDTNGKKVLSLLEQYPNLESYVSVDSDIPTVTKTRFVSGKQHIMRYDQETHITLDEGMEAQIIQTIQDVCKNADAIIVSDYNKGFVTSKIKNAISNLDTKAYKIVDSKGTLKEYVGFDIVTPNVKEMENFTFTKITDGKTMGDAVDTFYKMYPFENILVTASEKGMYLFEKIGMKKNPLHIPAINMAGEDMAIEYSKVPVWRVHSEPAYNSNPVDVSGAGDTVVSALAVGRAMGMSNQYALEFASHCAAVSISKSGTSYVTVEELKARYNQIQCDYRDAARLKQKIVEQKQMGRTIGFVNGCFDLFHKGHLELLRKAKERCNYLIVGVNSDVTVKKLKGETRPINDEQTRCDILSSLKFVDEVVIFDEEDPRALILKVVPDFVFKGREYETKVIVEQVVLDNIHADLVFLDTHEQTTSSIISKIKSE
jgi:D-beta-D-heptose 7-phosphate kinase/D-beta-D-heptose 1-phosphate adenosyltransferase